MIEDIFQKFLVDLVERGLLDLKHCFFDRTPVKARASINPYCDEVYTELLVAIAEKL